MSLMDLATQFNNYYCCLLATNSDTGKALLGRAFSCCGFGENCESFPTKDEPFFNYNNYQHNHNNHNGEMLCGVKIMSFPVCTYIVWCHQDRIEGIMYKGSKLST